MPDSPARRTLMILNDTIGEVECAACPCRTEDGKICTAYGKPLRTAVQGRRVRVRRVYACLSAEREARKLLEMSELVKAWKASPNGDRDRDLLLGLAKLESLD